MSGKHERKSFFSVKKKLGVGKLIKLLCAIAMLFVLLRQTKRRRGEILHRLLSLLSNLKSLRSIVCAFLTLIYERKLLSEILNANSSMST